MSHDFSSIIFLFDGDLFSLLLGEKHKSIKEIFLQAFHGVSMSESSPFPRTKNFSKRHFSRLAPFLTRKKSEAAKAKKTMNK